MKRIAYIALALLALALFPGLATALAQIAAAVTVWIAGQPVLCGFVVGCAAWPRIQRTRPARH